MLAEDKVNIALVWLLFAPHRMTANGELDAAQSEYADEPHPSSRIGARGS